MRTFIIGDIHGGYRSLQQVINRSGFVASKDRIICIGDYVDGWPDSYEVVDYLIDLQEKCNGRNIYLLGNHDQWFYEVLRDNMDQFQNQQFINSFYMNWYRQGGQATYQSYAKQSHDDLIRHKELFYEKLELYFIEDNVLYVHAGYLHNTVDKIVQLVQGLTDNDKAAKKAIKVIEKSGRQFENMT